MLLTDYDQAITELRLLADTRIRLLKGTYYAIYHYVVRDPELIELFGEVHAGRNCIDASHGT